MRNKPPVWLRWPALFGLYLLLLVLIPLIWAMSWIASPLIDAAEWAKERVDDLTS